MEEISLTKLEWFIHEIQFNLWYDKYCSLSVDDVDAMAEEYERNNSNKEIA